MASLNSIYSSINPVTYTPTGTTCTNVTYTNCTATSGNSFSIAKYEDAMKYVMEDAMTYFMGIDKARGTDSIGLSIYGGRNVTQGATFRCTYNSPTLEYTSSSEDIFKVIGLGYMPEYSLGVMPSYPYAYINPIDVSSDWSIDPQLNKRSKFKNNLIISRKSRADLIPNNVSDNEKVAIETLREDITEAEFRKYLKYGFVLVKARSGKTYQIFRNRNHTRVWLGGKLVEEICVRIKDYKIPPTDNVIALKTMLEIDEEECRSLANVYKMKAA